MIEVKPITRDYPENAWSYSKGADGTIKLTRRTRGKASELAKEASAVAPGSIVDIVADETMPFSGTYVVESVGLEWDGPGWATLTRVYTSKNNGGSFTLGENKSENNEVLDFQTLEKPLTSAKFWRESSEGNMDDATAQAKGMKAVQAYIDAEDHAKGMAAARKILGYDMGEVHLKMATKRMQGVEAFYVPAPVLTRTETKTSKPSKVGAGIAKITTNPDIEHVPVPAGFKWLGGGERVTWNGTAFIHERTWIGAEEWDRDLYGEVSEKA